MVDIAVFGQTESDLFADVFWRDSGLFLLRTAVFMATEQSLDAQRPRLTLASPCC